MTRSIEEWQREVEETDRALQEALAEIDRLKNPLAYNPPGEDIYVVVTEASKKPGSAVVKHAWGPYTTRNKAQASAQRFQRNAKEEGHVTKTSVLKIISS